MQVMWLKIEVGFGRLPHVFGAELPDPRLKRRQMGCVNECVIDLNAVTEDYRLRYPLPDESVCDNLQGPRVMRERSDNPTD